MEFHLDMSCNECYFLNQKFHDTNEVVIEILGFFISLLGWRYNVN